MVDIYCNSRRCEYDIRALVMAFFPYENPGYHILEDDDSVQPRGNGTAVRVFMREDGIEVSCGDKRGSRAFYEIPDTKTYRDELKRLLYQVLSAASGEELPWGTLTGVRPVKLAMKKVLSGHGRSQIVDYMREEFFCSEAKAGLCADIAAKEAEILKKIGFYEGYSIYIGIPFCPTVCDYCSFSSMPLAGMDGAEALMSRYLDALEKEFAYVAKAFRGRRLTSIYVGGGTPTALSPRHLKRLAGMISNYFDAENVLEYTVEAGRPDTIDEEKLSILKEAGATRVSVNPQTMNDDTLALVGRKHSAAKAEDAYFLARKAGFDNINMDIIAGLGREGEDDFSYTLKRIGNLSPGSFTVHSLVVKRASEYRKIKEEEGIGGQRRPVSRMLDMAAGFAKENGYKPYYLYRQKNKAGLSESPVLENVGYAKEGRECIYNIAVMEEKQTVAAMGAGAQSKLVKPYDPYADEVTGIVRSSNVKNVYEYMDRIDEMVERKARWIYGSGID